MSRKSREAAEAAAAQANQAASEAGRTLQAQRQSSADTPAAQESGGVEQVVADDTERERPPPRNEPRRLAMEEIASRHERTSGYQDAPPAPPKPVQAPEPPVPTPDQMLQGSRFAETPIPAEVPVAAVDETAPEPVKTVRVKVDGEEFDAPQADVDEAGGVKSYQIQRAAENRLKQTNETLAETRRAQQALLEWSKQNIAPPAPKPSLAELGTKLAQARFGTDEEYSAALTAYNAAANPQVDQGLIVAQATASMRYDTAKAQFSKQFGPLLANPAIAEFSAMLQQKALAPLNENGQTNWAKVAQVDWDRFFGYIGTQLSSVTGRQNQPQPVAQAAEVPAATSGNTSQSPSDREARKASIVNLPAVAAARAAPPKEEKPQSRLEILDELRKSRGIQTG